MTGLSAVYSDALAPRISSSPAKKALPREEDANARPASSPVTDVVTLSNEAETLLAAKTDTPVNSFAKFFPTRDGSPANALAAAVTNPGATSSSTGKSFDEVAMDARARLDAKYAEMKESGQPFDFNSSEGKDWYALFGDLDRRSLYAVRSNEGGSFTKEEQDIAQSIMGQQQGLAMGLYTGPTRLAGEFSDPYFQDDAARMKAGVRFLDGVSAEEQSSIEWAASRASAQISYEWIMEDEGKAPENLDSSNPLVRLITAAMNTMRTDPSRATWSGTIESADDLRNAPWFADFVLQLDDVLEQRAAGRRASSTDVEA